MLCFPVKPSRTRSAFIRFVGAGLSVFCFAPAGSTQIAAAPSVAGIWLGTLAAGPQTLRIQLHLQADITGPGRCVLDSVDQGAFGISCSLTIGELTTKAMQVNIDVPAVSGKWTGTLSTDGRNLAGTWTQGVPLPLTFSRQDTALQPPKAAAEVFDPALPSVPLDQLKSVLDRDLSAALEHGALAPATHAGITIGVVQHGARQVYTFGIAHADSLFEIGSISKTFTGLILAQMVEQHSVRFDEPVRDLLPAGTVAKPANGAEITLLALSDQHSGLPRLPTNFKPADPSNPYADYDTKRLYEFMSQQGVALPPNAPFAYSNLGVGLLGQALAVRAELSYADLLRMQISAPLDMHDTVIALTPALRSRMLQGYDAAHRPAHLWDLDVLAGAGGIRSTASDMLTYLEAQLHPNHLPRSATMSPEGKTLPVAIANSHVLRAEAGPDMHIALNWFHYDGTGSYWHNGGTGGYTAFALFNQDKDFGVVVLCNQTVGPQNITDALGRHIAQRLEGRPAVSLAPSN